MAALAGVRRALQGRAHRSVSSSKRLLLRTQHAPHWSALAGARPRPRADGRARVRAARQGGSGHGGGAAACARRRGIKAAQRHVHSAAAAWGGWWTGQSSRPDASKDMQWVGAHSAAVDVAAVNAVVVRSSVRTAVRSTARHSAARHGLGGGPGKALESMQATTCGARQMGAHRTVVGAQRQAGSRGGAQQRAHGGTLHSAAACSTARPARVGIGPDNEKPREIARCARNDWTFSPVGFLTLGA